MSPSFQPGKVLETRPTPGQELAWAQARVKAYPTSPYAWAHAAREVFHQHRCQEALEVRRQAVSKLPGEWPREE
ncbi:hypothetical protein [Myxococcus stipitatus]|uniref:hypothetical protein n=1 Tax=Myxococcus stipitatus TaxID=83455 RepID=UPI0030CDC8B3